MPCVQGCQEKVLNLLELEFHTVMNSLTWVLGIKPFSSGRAIHTLKH